MVKDELKKFDYVILLSTETNLYKFDFGFADSYFMTSEVKEEHDKEQEILGVINNIKNNSDWLESVKKNAEEKNITLDESLRRNAIFVINNRTKK